MCVVNVASYDNYMLINSYLTFCFLLFAFCYDNLIAIRCISVVITFLLHNLLVVCGHYLCSSLLVCLWSLLMFFSVGMSVVINFPLTEGLCYWELTVLIFLLVFGKF